MEPNKLKALLEKLNTITFWQRVFGWRSVKEILIDAAAELQLLTGNTSAHETTNTQLVNDLKLLKETVAGNARLSDSLSARIVQLEKELSLSNEKLSTSDIQLQKANEHNARLLKDEEFRSKEHASALATLKQIQDNITDDRKKEVDDAAQKEIARIKNLKDTWATHQQEVQNAIKTLCSKHTIQYIDKVPFTGTPDNTIQLSGEYIVFDAKSPGGDDLKNFPLYIKDQAERAKKYAKQENVKAEIFFVVPANTLGILKTFTYDLGDHKVYIISTDALEPVMLSLQKIEEYEFAEQLSPEDRDNICRILGKFAHLSKRRIQIDSFFAKQFIELAYKAENDLPKDVMDSVIAFEKAEKLNPPQEKRAKQISTKELELDANKIIQDANAKGILTQDLSDKINELPLYTDK